MKLLHARLDRGKNNTGDGSRNPYKKTDCNLITDTYIDFDLGTYPKSPENNIEMAVTELDRSRYCNCQRFERYISTTSELCMGGIDD